LDDLVIQLSDQDDQLNELNTQSNLQDTDLDALRNQLDARDNQLHELVMKSTYLSWQLNTLNRQMAYQKKIGTMILAI
jgi:uncharacterized coiled-coil protein SlyX